MTIQWQLQPPQPSRRTIKSPFAQPCYLKEKLSSHAPTHIAAETAVQMKRIVIIGSSGSGKSTLARQLGSQLNLPIIHLDRVFWHPGWVGTPQPAWMETIRKLTSSNEWIIDGNYRNTLNIRLNASDTVIFLDLPRWLCVWRATKRRFQYANRPRPDMAEGCQESVLDPTFPRFLRHVWDYPNRARQTVLRQMERLTADKHLIWLRSPEDVRRFLARPHNWSTNPIPTNIWHEYLARFDG